MLIQEFLKAKLPPLYSQFLEEIKDCSVYVIVDTGISLYSQKDLVERNQTYEVDQYEPDFLFKKMEMIRFALML